MSEAMRLRDRLLRAAIRALYRLGRWDHHTIPVGIPTIRDPEYRCEGYSPTRLAGGGYDCNGDGHYLCEECLHHKNEETDDEP